MELAQPAAVTVATVATAEAREAPVDAGAGLVAAATEKAMVGVGVTEAAETVVTAARMAVVTVAATEMAMVVVAVPEAAEIVMVVRMAAGPVAAATPPESAR